MNKFMKKYSIHSGSSLLRDLVRLAVLCSFPISLGLLGEIDLSSGSVLANKVFLIGLVITFSGVLFLFGIVLDFLDRHKRSR
jgi:hypothetical protein